MRWRSVLIRLAIALSIGWSACAGGFAYVSAPEACVFQLASETVVEQFLWVEKQAQLEKTKPWLADLQEREMQPCLRMSILQARGMVKSFASINSLIWLIPIIGIWSLVWIFAPLSKER